MRELRRRVPSANPPLPDLPAFLDNMHKSAYASTCIKSRPQVRRPWNAEGRYLAIAAPNRRRPMTLPGLDKWYGYMKSHDRAALWDLLHPDAVFESPVVHTPQRGRDITFKYLASAEKELGGPGFSYGGGCRSSTGGKITHFKVMVRPLKAINLLHRLMGEQLAMQRGDAGVAKSQSLS